jgi:hypothetical protein
MVAASPELLRSVRAGFIQQGLSLTKWCVANEIKRQWATAVLIGRRDGPAARAMRSQIIAAAFRTSSAA